MQRHKQANVQYMNKCQFDIMNHLSNYRISYSFVFLQLCGKPSLP